MTFEDIKKERERLGIQMGAEEMEVIVNTVKPPIKFLVFGLGNDSIFWHDLNKGGETVFLEGKRKWFRDITERHPFLKAYKMDYDTKRSEWKELLNHPEKLMLELPQEIAGTKWDAIFVDGPAGHDDEAPGRMKSIFTASKIIKNGGDVFIHDAEREVEKNYAARYLGEKNLVTSVKGFSVLHHYRVG